MRFFAAAIVLAFPVLDLLATARFARWSGVPAWAWLAGGLVAGIALLRSEGLAFRSRTVAAARRRVDPARAARQRTKGARGVPLILAPPMIQQMEPHLSSKSQERLDTISQQAKRASDLIKQILDFSRSSAIEMQCVDLALLLEELTQMLERILPENISLKLSYPASDYRLNGDSTCIMQLLTNLALNARDAMPTGGRLTIETRNVVIEKGTRHETLILEEGSYVMLALKDSGHGMTKEVQAHLFEPFYTTKESGKGTGLGLSTVYGIVKQSGGTIGIESQPGSGTVCKIYFPRVAELVQESDVVQKGASPSHGQETMNPCQRLKLQGTSLQHPRWYTSILQTKRQPSQTAIQFANLFNRLTTGWQRHIIPTMATG